MKTALLPIETEKTKSQNVRGFFPQTILWENSLILDTVQYTSHHTKTITLLEYAIPRHSFDPVRMVQPFILHYPDCDLLLVICS